MHDHLTGYTSSTTTIQKNFFLTRQIVCQIARHTHTENDFSGHCSKQNRKINDICLVFWRQYHAVYMCLFLLFFFAIIILMNFIFSLVFSCCCCCLIFVKCRIFFFVFNYRKKFSFLMVFYSFIHYWQRSSVHSFVWFGF